MEPTKATAAVPVESAPGNFSRQSPKADCVETMQIESKDNDTIVKKDDDEGDITSATSKDLGSNAAQGAKFTLAGLFLFSGTGFMAAVAFLDPGNLEADIQVGVTSGYSLLWWYCLCILGFGFAFQALSGKLGLVTGNDLAHSVGRMYPRSGRLVLWGLLELSILAADIQETVGCALAVQILSNGAIPLWAACIIVSVAAFTMLQVDRFGFRHLEIVYFLLIVLEAVALAMICFNVRPPFVDVVKGFIPKLSTETVVVAAGALGALVMPYNTFFQSHVINARPRDTGTDDKKRVTIRYMQVEIFTVLAAAFILNLFAVIVFAKFEGQEEFQDMGLESAGQVLYDAFGRTVQICWAIGLLASGLVATLCLTYAGQVIMVGLLQISVQATWRMLATRLIALLPCLTLAVVFEATHTFDQVAQIINVIQSLILPFGLIPIVYATSSVEIMGPKWANKNWVTIIISFIVAAVIGVNVYTLVSLMITDLPQVPGTYVWMSFIIALYCSLITYFTVGPSNWPTVITACKHYWEITSKKSRVLAAWLKTNARWADVESMLEVHY